MIRDIFEKLKNLKLVKKFNFKKLKEVEQKFVVKKKDFQWFLIENKNCKILLKNF